MKPLAGDLLRHRLASIHSADDALVFAASSGRTIGPRDLAARGLERAADRAEVTLHVLRHTFASMLIAQGNDPAFVSCQLGHANAAITLKVYAHLFDAARHADDARRRLEEEYGMLFG